MSSANLLKNPPVWPNYVVTFENDVLYYITSLPTGHLIRKTVEGSTVEDERMHTKEFVQYVWREITLKYYLVFRHPADFPEGF